MAISSDVKRIGRLSAVYVAGGFVPVVLGALILPIITRYLPPEQMGIPRLARQLVPGIRVLMHLGLLAAMRSMYLRAGERTRPMMIRTALGGTLFQAMVIGVPLALAGLIWPASLLPNMPLSTWYLRLAWMLILIEALFMGLERMGGSVLELEERAGSAVLIRLVRAFVQIGLGLLLVAALAGGGLGRQASLAIGALISGTLSVRYLAGRGRGAIRPALYRRMLRKGASFLPHQMSGLLGRMGNAWLLNALVDSTAMGLYGIAIQFTSPLQLPAMAVCNASFPTLSRLMRDNTPASRARQARIHALNIAGLSVLGLSILYLADLAIRLLTTAEYQPARRVVPLLVAASVLETWSMVLSMRIIYHGRGWRISTTTVLSTVTALGLSAALIPLLGLQGAGLALLGSAVARALLVSVLAERTHRLPWPLTSLVGFCGGVFVLGAVDAAIPEDLAIWLDALCKVALLAALIPLALIVRIATPKELRQLAGGAMRKLGLLRQPPEQGRKDAP